jgi:ParB family chromosome partitioning protein
MPTLDAVNDKIEQMLKVKLSDIFADSEFNCRGGEAISPTSVIDLAKSIDEKGLLQPILVAKMKSLVGGKMYRLIAGFRRYRAHEVLKRDSIDAKIIECENEEEAMILNITENIQRQELNILQEAQVVRKFLERGWTQQRVADKLKVSRTWVIIREKLLLLPEAIQKEAAAGLINQTQVLELAKMLRAEDQYEVVKRIKDAREKGERIPAEALKPDKDLNSDVKPNKNRSKPEVFQMMEEIAKICGMNFGTRCMAWCIGHVSDVELKEDAVKEKK